MVGRRTRRARSCGVGALGSRLPTRFASELPGSLRSDNTPIQSVGRRTISQLQLTRPLFVLAGIASALTITVFVLVRWL
jgi:hypothetical protein